MSANESSAGNVSYTPRRSNRISKLDISAREVADLLASQDSSSLRIRRTPRQSSLMKSSTASEEVTSARSPVKHQSSGNKAQKNQKKKNKKSKKQRAKANQKRKDVKKVDSQSEDAESQSDAEVESGIEASPTVFSAPEAAQLEVAEVEDVVVETANGPDPECETAVVEEVVSPVLESGMGSMDMDTVEVVSSPLVLPLQSPNINASGRDDVINLITPDIMPKETSKQATTADTPESPVEIMSVDGEKSSEDLNGTFEISQTEMPSAVPSENGEINASTHETTFDLQASGDQTSDPKMGPRYSSTPARKSVADRKSTPFKPLSDSALKTIMSEVASPTPTKIDFVMASPIVTPVLLKFVKTPLKSALRGNMRSISIDTAVDLNTTTKKGVVFHSPSNTTMHIDEVDFIMKSKKKMDGKKKGESVKEEVGRQRRSMSLVETESEKEFLKSLQAKMEEIDVNKAGKRDPTPKSRTKLPNFTAIHKHNFEKMESISAHVARKTERAKILSASKPKTDKEQSGALKKDIKRLNQCGPRPMKSVPKARQRIELSNIKVNRATVEAIKSTVLNNKTVRPLTATKPNAPLKKMSDNKNSQDPKVVKATKPTAVVLPGAAAIKEASKQPKPTAVVPPIPGASKDASQQPKPTAVVPPVAGATKETSKPQNPSAPQKDDQVPQKKHISMFKTGNGRTNTSVLHESRTEQQQFISGVRSNRRFVLQMQHRDRLK